jgi:hypothetical protein
MENYKQKYEQAFERAKGLYNSVFVNNDVLEQIFPELLKENENYDEKIRNALINRFNESGELDGIPYDDIRIWLEKQNKQKPTLEDAAKAFLEALSDTPYNNKPITDAQVITTELLKFLSNARSYNPNAINEQKLTEWTEEEEDEILSQL